MSTKDYRGAGFVISYDAKRCIHAAECVHGAPQVFDPNAKPWIRADRGDAALLAEVVSRCPTGALTMKNADGSAAEVATLKNTATLIANGPIYLRGQIEQAAGDDAAPAEFARVALCRCGASTNKPFCDGSHTKAGFTDAGLVTGPPEPTSAATTGKVILRPITNGPLRVDGNFELISAEGKVHVCSNKTWLCRCGHSANKPFCDGTHKKIGFST